MAKIKRLPAVSFCLNHDSTTIRLIRLIRSIRSLGGPGLPRN